jgi:histidine ammonia-lyase
MRVLLGNRTVTSEEVYQISVYQAVVQIDSAALAVLETNTAKMKVKPQQWKEDAKQEGGVLSLSLARACVVGLLVRFLSGKSAVRPCVVEALASLLNEGNKVLNSIPSNSCETAIARSVLGLATDEYAAFTKAGVLPGASLALCVYAGGVALDVADCAAALVIEADGTTRTQPPQKHVIRAHQHAAHTREP